MLKRTIYLILISCSISVFSQTNEIPAIKSIKTTNYEAIRTVETIEKSEVRSVTVEEFDQQGHLIFERKFDPINGRPLDYVKKTYDVKGHLILVEEFDEKQIARKKTESTYNVDGFEIEIRYNEALGPEAFMEFIGSTKFEYTNGLMTLRADFKKDGTLDSKYSYNYNAQGKIIETIGYLKEKPIGKISSFTYDVNGNCIEILDYDPHGNPLKNFEGKYDEKSNIIESSIYSGTNTLLLRSKYSYEFDANGNIIRETNEQFMDESDGSNKSFIEYTYNQYNKKILILYSDALGEPTEITEIEYQYWN